MTIPIWLLLNTFSYATRQRFGTIDASMQGVQIERQAHYNVWHLAALVRIGPKRPSTKARETKTLNEWMDLHRHLSKEFSTTSFTRLTVSHHERLSGRPGLEIAILIYPQVSSCAALINSFIVGGVSNQLMCSGAFAL